MAGFCEGSRMMVTEQNKTEPQMEENETRMCDCREQNLYNSGSVRCVSVPSWRKKKGVLFYGLNTFWFFSFFFFIFIIVKKN